MRRFLAMADSIRAVRARYEEWEKSPSDENWERFFQDVDRNSVEYVLSLETNHSDIDIVDTDTLTEVTEKYTYHLEEQTRNLEKQKRNLEEQLANNEETGRDLFDQLEELGIPDRKFDSDYAGPLWNDPVFHRARLGEIGTSLAMGNNTISPKASAYLSRALLDIAHGVPAEEALHIKNTKKISRAIRDQWITIDYLRLRDRGVNAKAAQAEVMGAWGINSASTVKDIVRRNKKSVLSDLENEKQTVKDLGLDWDDFVDYNRPGTRKTLTFDRLSEMRTKYSEDI